MKMPKVVTANTLDTGHVVFLAANGTWVGKIAEAKVYDDSADAEVGLAKAKRDQDRALIVEPFVTEKGPDREDGRPAMTLRDTIRAYGPTIRFQPDVPGRG